MKKTTIAMVMALSLTSGCAGLHGDSAYPDSLGSASSVSSAGEFGWLYTLLGVGLILFLLNNNNDSGSGSGSGGET